ncbi:MAG: DNA internalization-related competence protein ComEC/Rec2 [Deltaproteobacteria bacterium]|nr:DNA internalization-related competence protein ComEC/Rec2 [Deltaproteobacteria bacterium]
MQRPLLYPLIAIVAGILAGDNVAAALPFVLAAAAAVLSLLLLCLRRGNNRLSFVFILIFLLIVGFFSIQKQSFEATGDRHILHHAGRGRLCVEGAVLSIEELPPFRAALVVNCRRLLTDGTYFPVTGNVRLIVPLETDYRHGDFIRFSGEIRKIRGFQNPGSFNYERHLHRRGISASVFVADRAGSVLIRRNTDGGLRLRLENFRRHLQEMINAHAPTPQREILAAMIIGRAKAIPQDVRDDFAKTGTSHILAISGLHVGLVAAAAFFLILSALKSSEYLMLRFNILKAASAAAFAPVLLYALVAGMGTTVVRAALMALAFLAALWLEKQRDLFNILFGAALGILIASPAALFDISFQLSFSAVFAILAIVPRFSTLPLPSRAPLVLQAILRRVYLFILVSAAATLGTLPILVYYFNQVSAVTLIANLAVVPLLGVFALIPAMAFILTALFSPWLAGGLISVASFFAGIAIRIIHSLASLSWSSFNFIKPHPAEIILFYAFLFLLVHLAALMRNPPAEEFASRRRTRAKWALTIVLALMIADIAYGYGRDRFSSNLEVTAVDVGQGAATFVRFPGGTTMLIDGGGFSDSAFDAGRFIVAPFLYASRVRKIDIAVLTHPHPDHLQGLIYIVERFAVREVWCTGRKADDDLYRLWEKTLSARRVRIRDWSAQSPPEELAGVRLRCLWPLHPPDRVYVPDSFDETNDASLVMKITFGSTSFLFTGDISARVEAHLIRAGGDLRSDVLFVPHHGSLHSSSRDFIRATACRYAVVSAGGKNIFGHPHPDVLERFDAFGVLVFRTDRDGAIRMTSDGRRLKVAPWLTKERLGRSP